MGPHTHTHTQFRLLFATTANTSTQTHADAITNKWFVSEEGKQKEKKEGADRQTQRSNTSS